MPDAPLTDAETELLGAVIERERALAALHGPPDHLEPGLLALVRRGYVDVRGPEGPIDRTEVQRILLGPRPERPPGLFVRATAAGRAAWEALGIASERGFADLEREARHLRGF
jgi:hypothetical protein